MRKIISKQSEAKRRKRNQIIVGIILVVVMFGSVFGVVVGNFGTSENSDDKIIYNGVEFFKSNNYWVANIGGVDFVFRYNPKEANYIDGEVDSLNKYIGEPIYVYSEDEISRLEIYQNLQKVAGRIQDACFEKCEKDLPVKTCEERFIIIQESNETNIIQNESCVFITGKKEDLVKITDEFLYKAIGLIN